MRNSSEIYLRSEKHVRFWKNRSLSEAKHSRDQLKVFQFRLNLGSFNEKQRKSGKFVTFIYLNLKPSFEIGWSDLN